MTPDKRAISTTTDGKPPREGYEDAPTPAPIPAGGQAAAYWVLSEAERRKGFVRPVRDEYKHIGPPKAKHPLRDLTPEEAERYATYRYVAYEAYPESESPVLGRFWTQEQLQRTGCGTITRMGPAIAETYARDPGYYGSTFCVRCGGHFPVGADGEFAWLDGSMVGT